MKVIVGVTGASGSIYARQLLEGLLAAGAKEPGGTAGYGGTTVVAVERIGLIISCRGAEVADWEGVEFPAGDGCIERFDNDDMFASPASGSARWDTMVVVPCSMACVGRIASGVSSDLIARAADVTLKEGRMLVVVPREAPLNLIHMRNLTALTEAGAVVLPASPSFYSRPASVEEVCATVTDRILSRLGLARGGYEWGATK